MTVYCTHRIHATCFSDSCGRLQGGALQRVDTLKYYRKFETKYGYKIDFINILFYLCIGSRNLCNISKCVSYVGQFPERWPLE
jgi:hypothetical protein